MTNKVINVVQVTLKSARSQRTNMFYGNRNSFARVLNWYFILPTCKFAYLSAEHISDLGSNQDRG